MATDPQLAIQEAVFKALSEDVDLNCLIKGVFDFVPDVDSEFPYVTIGADNFSDFGSHTFDGVDGFVNVDTWTRGSGRKECKTIMKENYRILHNATLIVIGFCVVTLRRNLVETVLDPDGQTYHGIERYELILTD